MPKDNPENGRKQDSFYEISEAQLHGMAIAHLRNKIVVSGYSSWAASLHLVLCYAMKLTERCSREVHVAVMDTLDLEDDVLVWHAPHLVGRFEHEYLAFGRIMGEGYQAVRFSDLKQHGILNLLPEMQYFIDAFGDDIRVPMFRALAVQIEPADLNNLMAIGPLFGKLSFPVITALACLRPRHWSGYRKAGGIGPGWPEIKEDIRRYAEELKIAHAPPGLHREPWLVAGMVDTEKFPDVEQWIDLMAMFGELLPEQQQSDPPLLQVADVPSRVPEEAEVVDPQQSELSSTGDGPQDND
jgi:hypothetical protein